VGGSEEMEMGSVSRKTSSRSSKSPKTAPAEPVAISVTPTAIKPAAAAVGRRVLSLFDEEDDV
jgi:hypothetical protein